MRTMTSESIIIIRGKITRYIKTTTTDKNDNSIMITEYEGVSTLLSDDGLHVIITKEEAFDLVSFLSKDASAEGKFVTIQRVEVTKMADLFNTNEIKDRWESARCSESHNTTGLLHFRSDGELTIGERPLYEFFWDGKGNRISQYNYIEIHIFDNPNCVEA